MADSRTIAFLVQDGITLLDVAGPADVFHHADAFGAGYETVVVSLDGHDVRASNGVTLRADAAVGALGRVDTLVVPGAYGMVSKPLPVDVVTAVREVSARSRRTASVCTGSFLLAAAGLLDGRRATTHWTRTDLFRRSFPNVRVADDALFVRDGRLLTSAGLGSGVDLALTLLEDDHGPAVAGQVVRQMLIFFQRPGDSSQFSVRTGKDVPLDRPLRRLVDTIATDPAGHYSLERMARIAQVSKRQLGRLTRQELDTTPGRYVEDVRLEMARTLLLKGHTVRSTAELSGFGSAETLRRVFLSRLGMSPSRFVGP